MESSVQYATAPASSSPWLARNALITRSANAPGCWRIQATCGLTRGNFSCRRDCLPGGLASLLASQYPAGTGRIEVQVVRAHSRDPGDVRIEHTDSGLGPRSGTVPDGSLARDLELRLIRHLGRRVVAELARFRGVSDRGSTLAVVAEPDVAFVVALRIVRPRQIQRQLELRDLAALGVDVPYRSAVVDAEPHPVLQVHARAANSAGLSQHGIVGELARLGILCSDPGLAARH